MNVSKFAKLEELTKEYNLCWDEAKKADQAAREIMAAVRARIENDRKTTAERMHLLQSQIADKGKSETVRRVADMELKTLEGKSYAVTEEERAAVEKEISRARAAIYDSRKIAIREALQEAEAELKAARADTIGNTSKDFSLCERWIESRESELLNM